MKKRSSDESKTIMALVAVVLLSATLIILAYSVSFNSGPSISPSSTSRPDTTDDLTCSWNASVDTTSANVTWQNGSVAILNLTGITSGSSTLSSTYTARGENWYCNVTLTNGTNTQTSWTNTTIRNAVPSTPNMTNSSTGIVGNITEAYEDVANSYTIFASDPDSDSIIYGYIGGLPSGATLDTNTGVFSWTPAYTAANTNVTFYATDNYGDNPGITTKKVQFNVTLLNDAPTLTALSNRTINESQVFNYAITAADEETNYPLNFSITITPSLSLVVLNTSNTGSTIMFQSNGTASFGSAGNYTVNVSVRDTLNATSNSSFNLQIVSVNRPPVIETINESQLAGTQGQTYSKLFRVSDPDANQTLNFTIETLSCTYGDIWDNITTTITNQVNSTNATGNLSITLLDNRFVVCRSIQVIVTDDRGAEDSETVFLNITNTNDPPIVQILSTHLNNTAGQTNISSLTAYANAVFTYYVNSTDNDSLTYEGEVLTYTDNTSLFDINSTSGAVTFTPTSGQIGNYTINITASDDSGSTDSRTMSLSIISNSPPVLNPIGNQTCYEDQFCYVFLNASDADGDNVSFTSNNTAVFNVTTNSTAVPVLRGHVNYTPTQSQIGSYSVLVTATDMRGASDNETITFTINNTNDAPSMAAFTFPFAVEQHVVSFNVYASDQDYDLASSYEYVNFSVINQSGALIFNITTSLNASNQTYGQVVFTPQLGSAGSYTINFTATDYYGLTSTIQKVFTIYPKTTAPNVTFVRPFVNSDGSINQTFTNASIYTSNQLSANLTENITVIFDINVTDDTTNQTNINYTWSVNGAEVLENKSYSRAFNFFSSGTYDISVLVEDTNLENTTFAWNFTVSNLNRPPILVNNLANLLAINGTTIVTDYLEYYASSTRFIDPDDDIDGDNYIDANETNTLTFSASTCEVASISITDSDIRIQPNTTGTCSVTFTATDAGSLSLASNTVTFNVTQYSNDTTEVEVPSSSSGGGGTSRRSPLPIPITKQEVKPQAIQIIVPEIITLYKNNTVLVPVIIQNNWNESLTDIAINATSDSELMKFSFSKDFIPKLEPGQAENVTLTITNYRLGEDYKVEITANVTDPKTGDSAFIYLNSIEQSESGHDVETKVTFAQDLLNQNPECLELNELLTQAKENIASGGDLEEAERIVDGVIEGCKYLVSVSKKSVQRPETVLQKALDKKYRPYLISFLAVAATAGIGMTTIKRRNRILKKKAAEEAKRKAREAEEDALPYDPVR